MLKIHWVPVSAVVIDALGSFYYFDKFDADRRADIGEPPVDLQLVKAMKALQATGRVTTYVTKCALFESEKLTATWPKGASFSPEGLPNIPRDIMPKVWQTVVSHVILLYHVASEPGTADMPDSVVSKETDGASKETHVVHRGLIAMAFVQANRSSLRQLQVYAASVLQIGGEDIVCQ